MCRSVQLLLILAVTAVLAPSVLAQVGEVESVRMMVHPASPPVPALRYTFRPDIVRETPRNAAALYKEVAAEIGDLPDEVEAWRKLPPDQLPVEKVRALLDEHLPPERWEKLVAASLCREVDWETDLRQKGIQALLPHLKSVRDLARLIALRAQVQMGDGDYASAVATLAVGFELARDVQADPLLIETLIAEGINRLMLEQVRTLQQMAGAPNLYWALADLPQPLVNFHEAMRRERRIAEFTFPALRRIREGEIDDKEIGHVIGQLAGWITPARGNEKLTEDESKEVAAAVAAAIGPAREHFRKRGWTEQRMDEMSEQSLVGLYMIESFDAEYDDLMKWTALPYWQGYERLVAQREAAQAQLEQRINLLMTLMPPFSGAWTMSVERDRDLAIMQNVEALRAYAATNDGRFPERLEEMVGTPAPIDPSTGQPFNYQLDGKIAIITSPASGGARGLRYEVAPGSD